MEKKHNDRKLFAAFLYLNVFGRLHPRNVAAAAPHRLDTLRWRQQWQQQQLERYYI